MSSIDYAKVASILVGYGDPLSYSLKDDGSMVVIAPNGMKFRFTSDEVASALPKPAPKSVIKEDPKPPPQRKKSAPPKPK